MSGTVLIVLATLSWPQAAPHPSTQQLYQPPSIRPFESGAGFGQMTAQGDGGSEATRRPLDAPVTVEAYVRSYETPQSDMDVAYDQGVTSAEIRTDQTAGPLDGPWQVVDEFHETLFGLVLSDPGLGVVEGGWRDEDDHGSATWDGHTLTLEDHGTLTLAREGDGWSGTWTAGGRERIVQLRPR